MGEQIHAQQGHQVGQAPAEARAQLQVAQQQHRDQCRPDLGLHRVGRGAHEGLDLQVLLEGLEEQLDLPAVLVDRGDGAGPQADGWSGTRAHRRYPRARLQPGAARGALVVRAGAGQADDLVVARCERFGRLALLNDRVAGVGASCG